MDKLSLFVIDYKQEKNYVKLLLCQFPINYYQTQGEEII